MLETAIYCLFGFALPQPYLLLWAMACVAAVVLASHFIFDRRR